MSSTRRAFVVGERVRPLLRGGMVGLLLLPGASKFLTYGSSVQFFESLGLPSPALLVPVVGALELATAGLLLVDDATRLAALLAISLMAVAVATAGPSAQNLGVLAAGILLLGFDTWAEHPPD